MRTWLAALSLANLLLIRIWIELLGDQPEPAPTVWYGAALTSLLLLTALIWAVTRWGGSAGRVILLAAGTALFAKELTMTATFDAAHWKALVVSWIESGFRQPWWLPAVFAVALIIVWCAWRPQSHWVPTALIMLSPIAVVTVGRSAWRLVRPAQASAMVTPHVSPPSSAAAAGRVVWIVFDEFDERVAFSQRPAALRLPAFDTLYAESIVFRQAFSSSNSTVDAIPALLGDAFERPGLRAGLVGWFLPYCLTYGRHLVSCQAWPMDIQLNSYGTGFAGVVRNQVRSFFESNIYSLFGQSLAVEAHTRTLVEMEAAAVRIAARPDLDLVFLHIPLPHGPFVYNSARHDLSARNQDARGYFANLELADRVFSRIRASLRASGLWSSSHVIVAGDHGFRRATRLGYPPGDRHVPFIWKPAGAVAPQQVDRRFETNRSSGLVSRLLNGETAESVLAGYP